MAMERHADGSVHFHLVVRLTEKKRLKLAKQSLQESRKLPSHWSCTHTQLWSALRYVYVATPKKPDVDTHLLQWTCDGRVLDLDEKSKVPFVAVAWRRRRETLEATARVEGKKAPAFTKLDFHCVGDLQAFAHEGVVASVRPPSTSRSFATRPGQMFDLISLPLWDL